VFQAGYDPGLSEIGLDIVRGLDPATMWHLDCHGPPQLVVVGQIDLSKSALAQASFDAISTNLLGVRL